MDLRGVVLWALGVSGCVAGWSVATPAARVLRVDAAALPGGDGAPGRPFRTLLEAVEAAGEGEAELQVASGDYPGAVQLRPGLRVVGRGAVLVHAEDGCVMSASGGRLENVMVQGGEVGLCAAGEVHLRGVTLSGQRRMALRVSPGGALEAEGLRVEAVIPDTTGLELQQGARARLSGARFDGPFEKAVSSHNADLVVADAAFHDARTAVHLVGGKGLLRAVYAGGGRGPAVYVGQAQAEVVGLRTAGHEYGLLVGPGSRVKMRGLDSRGAERAGVGMEGAEGDLEDVSVLNAGNLGALQLTDSRVQVTRAEVKGPTYAGIQVLGGEAVLRAVRIRHVVRESAGDGDGMVVHRARVMLEDVSVEGAEGGALVVGSGAQVEAGSLEARFVQNGAVFAGGKSTVRVRSLKASGVGEVVLAAVEGARVQLQGLEAEDVAAVGWAECGSASRLCVGTVRGTAAATSPEACVQLGSEEHPAACR
ncbi:MAG: hypothetical protein FJ086_08360 [Deltaproteobacteria bacterium]|nr:hypothetical protein [Deltaproteobacteria bacterium]